MKILSFVEALKPAYRPVKPKPEELRNFNQALKEFKKNTDDTESEAHNVKPIMDFLKQIAYGDEKYKVNTYSNVDIAISEYKIPKVFIEVKKPVGNKTEMVTTKDLNKKALHESLLYYMREIDPPKKGNRRPNLAIGYIIITNNKEWFIIDAVEINNIAKHIEIKNAYIGIIRDRNYSKTTTEAFYNEAKGIIEKYKLLKDTKVVYINFGKKYSPVELQDIYKLFTPRHLLKDYGFNDSNTLNRKFYEELLHILGLKEKPSKGKKLIQRKPEGEREDGSLLENTILKLQTEQNINDENLLFEIALELNITWLNRILFLKLLEARLDSIHNQTYKKFLTTGIIKDFDILNTLFFEVLAIKIVERGSLSIKEFEEIPYLNSSLFEPTKLEKEYLRISNLKDNVKLKVFSSTKISEPPKELNSLEYLLEFLNAYSFSSDEAREFDDGNDSLINPAVLGLIFEKINGYKDGSFFTPSFVTTYMSRESIRRKVVDKFNEAYEIDAENIDEIYSYLKGSKLNYKEKDIKNSSDIINQITIIDPAVGSGHFLVSALNELLVIKSELKLFFGFDYTITVKNDELYIIDEVKHVFFKYCMSENGEFSSKIQKFQKKIFHEKQKIIENQLFGVDINPNSVKITRLRLWIELLKNSYYENGELVTLPNIDINIKCGNSLISKFPLRDSDAKNKLLKDNLNKYKELIKSYIGEKNKTNKESIEQKINNIKKTFREELSEFSPIVIKFKKALKEYVSTYKYDGLSEELILIAVKNNHGLQTVFFDDDETIKEAKAETKKKILDKLEKMHQTIEAYKDNKIYKHSFEWRFEFPEVLNEDGDFIGFDIVIGNPPYGIKLSKEEKTLFKEIYKQIAKGKYDTYHFFMYRSLFLLKPNGILSFIVPDTWMVLQQTENLREFILEHQVVALEKYDFNVFEDATVDTITILIENNFRTNNNIRIDIIDEGFNKKTKLIPQKRFLENDRYVFNYLLEEDEVKLLEKIKKDKFQIKDFCEWSQGLVPYSRREMLPLYGIEKTNEIMTNRSFHSDYQKDETFKKEIDGRDIGKYELQWNGKSWISYGKWLVFPRPQKFFTNPRILVQRIRNPKLKIRIVATHTEEEYYNNPALSNFIKRDNSNIDLKYILSILNSKMINWLYRKSFTDVNIKPTDLENLPIPNIDEKEQQPFVNLVDRIMELKILGESTAGLADEIDKMVYGLYGLTKEEINIIDPKPNKF